MESWDDVLDFDSVRTFLDFDVLILDLSEIKKDVERLPLGSDTMERRSSEIVEMLALGRTIVVFACDFQLQWLLLIEKITTVYRVGARMDFKGPDQLKEFWTKVQPHMEYLTYFDGIQGTPFLYIAETEKPVATWIKHGRGNILLMPWLIEGDFAKSVRYQNICSDFLKILASTIEKLSPKPTTKALPAWTSYYSWERENQFRSELFAEMKRVIALEKSIAKKSQELVAEEDLKILLSGKGDVLVEEAINTFRELGVKANKGKPGRDDIILKFAGKNAVVEVKGKRKSAGEEDAAQLEKWVSTFKADKGIDPKGILIINAFCEMPLAERNAEAFPHQMLKYSTQREHCLITTTQLLGLLLEARAKPEKRKDLVNGLFSTVGIYKEFSDWRKFLTTSAPTLANAK